VNVNLARNWQLVRHTESALRSGSESLGNVPALLRSLLEEDAWREFALPNGETVTYAEFPEFVAAHPPRGLGGEVSQLVALCGTDRDLVKKVKRLAKEAIPAANPHGGNNQQRATSLGDPDTADKVTARLKRDDPELADRVVSGEVTPNAAANEKGWRKPRLVLTSPASVARKLRERWTAEQIAELIRLLQETS
jgi:hypothetical protein